MFAEIKKTIRFGKISTVRANLSQEDVVAVHFNNADFVSWTKGARLGSKFSMSDNTNKYIYIRTDITDEEEIKKLGE